MFEEISPKETATGRFHSRQKETLVTQFCGLPAAAVHEKIAFCVLSISHEAWHSSSVLGWSQFLSFGSCLQELWPLVWIAFWEMEVRWAFFHFTDAQQGDWELIQIKFNNIGTKIQDSWFPRGGRDAASHLLLGPPYTARAFPKSLCEMSSLEQAKKPLLQIELVSYHNSRFFAGCPWADRMMSLCSHFLLFKMRLMVSNVQCLGGADKRMRCT